MATKSKSTVSSGDAVVVEERNLSGPSYRVPRPPIAPPEPEPANLFLHVSPLANPEAVEEFEAISNTPATAIVGEPVRIRLAGGDEVPKLELMTSSETCPRCGQDVPERTRKQASVEGDVFVAQSVGRFRLKVTDTRGRFAFVVVGVIPRSAYDHAWVSEVRSGIDRGLKRTPAQRWQLLRAFVRDRAGAGALEQLTPAQPFPLGTNFSLYG